MKTTLRAMQNVSEVIRSEAAATETAGRLTDVVVDSLRDGGVFRMTMSEALGGPELTPLEQIEVIEAVAGADGSAGWCAMINSDGGYMTAFLDPAVAKEMYPSLDLATSVAANPSGQAVIDGDDFRVEGQWAFASGSPHCDWFFLNCLVLEGDTMQIAANGLPTMRVMAIPAAEVEILDTWHTTGLAGTASNDVRVSGATVPRVRTFDLFEDRAVDPSPLYRWRFMFFANLSAVPLGLGRAAIEEARSVAATKVTMPTLALARDDGVVQQNIGVAEALVRGARAYVFDTVGKVWDAVVDGREPNEAEWTDARLALTHAFQNSKAAIGLLYEALGTTGVYRRSPLDRYLRDVTTMSQHVLCQTKTYGAAGRRLLGLDPAAVAF